MVNGSTPVPSPVNVIEALDAATGALAWTYFTPPPPRYGNPSSDTAAAFGVTALPGLAVYAQGNLLYGLSAANGSQLWLQAVSAGAYSGFNANLTSVTYAEPSAAQPAPMLLLASTTWQQTRFLAYALNGSAGRPPVVAWQMVGANEFEGSLDAGLQALGLALPQVSAADELFVFWTNYTGGWRDGVGGDAGVGQLT